MNCRIVTALVAVTTVLSAWPLCAHHGYAVVFDTSSTVTLTGILTSVDWRNPHIEISLDVRDDRGQTQAWVIEGGPPRFFQAKQVTKSQFETAIGQIVAVEALRAKDGSPLGALLKITFSDGKSVTSAPGA